jgi:hypothetical protein
MTASQRKFFSMRELTLLGPSFLPRLETHGEDSGGGSPIDGNYVRI